MLLCGQICKVTKAPKKERRKTWASKSERFKRNKV